MLGNNAWKNGRFTSSKWFILNKVFACLPAFFWWCPMLFACCSKLLLQWHKCGLNFKSRHSVRSPPRNLIYRLQLNLLDARDYKRWLTNFSFCAAFSHFFSLSLNIKLADSFINLKWKDAAWNIINQNFFLYSQFTYLRRPPFVFVYCVMIQQFAKIIIF